MHIILSSLTITFFVLCYISINKYITKYRIVKNEKPIKEYIIQGVTKKTSQNECILLFNHFV